jgi:hypothetical protein
VVASHELPPLKTHSRRHPSHPFGTIWTILPQRRPEGS